MRAGEDQQQCAGCPSSPFVFSSLSPEEASDGHPIADMQFPPVASIASRNRRTDEHKLLIASFRIGKDFVKACSKPSPSASKIFWAGAGVSMFPAAERTKQTTRKIR
jgi:hypothetical protein